MQNLGLKQSLLQKLSPQQIQFIKLLQIPTALLESRIEQELEENPVLETLEDSLEPEPADEYSDLEKPEAETDFDGEGDDDIWSQKQEEFDISEYIRDDDVNGYQTQGDGNYSEDDDRDEFPTPIINTLMDSIYNQLGYLDLTEIEYIIGEQLIGSLEEDGYMRRNLSSIVDDLAFSQNVEVTLEEVETVLMRIQAFEPAGIAARDLQECLSLQLERKPEEPTLFLAREIVAKHFEEFTKKHYDKISKKMDIDEEQLSESINYITRLNPKPGDTGVSVKNQTIIPDFVIVNEEGELTLSLNSKNVPQLRISRSYSEMFQAYSKSSKKDKKLKETVSFVKQKLDSAKWFIDAIRQRQQTLLKTMDAIMRYQYEYFLDGDESKLKPMILKDIADQIEMDISTVSRVANSKYVQTDFGILSLKYFFSEGIATDSGEDASSREVKKILTDLVDAENKSKPLADDKLAKFLNDKGYNIARRTVAKYREQLNIPVARLRKKV